MRCIGLCSCAIAQPVCGRRRTPGASSPDQPAYFWHRWGHTLHCLCPQVEQEGQYRSCCAVVTGLQRAVFFVPPPGVFGGEELARLEAAAAAAGGDTGARGELLRHLHVRTPSKTPCRGPAG